jgi:hypothetical protein
MGPFSRTWSLANLQICFRARTSILSTCTKHKLPYRWQTLIRFQSISYHLIQANRF